MFNMWYNYVQLFLPFSGERGRDYPVAKGNWIDVIRCVNSKRFSQRAVRSYSKAEDCRYRIRLALWASYQEASGKRARWHATHRSDCTRALTCIHAPALQFHLPDLNVDQTIPPYSVRLYWNRQRRPPAL